MTVWHPSAPPGRRVRRRPIVLAGAALVGMLIALGASSSFYTELLWFRETGYESVYWAGLAVRAGLGAAFGAAFALLVLLNIWIARRITSPTRLFSVPDQVLDRYRQSLQPYMRWVVIGGAILLGVFAGSGATVVWDEWQLFRNGVDFGQVDPLFAKDLGFYVFRLPFHRFLFTWGFSTLVVVTLITAFSHYFLGGIRPQGPGDRVAPEVRAHLSVLLGLIVLLKAWGYRLDQFGLLNSKRGVVTGASYTDVNAQLPALRLLVVIAIVVAVFFFLNARFKNWILPIAGIAILGLTSIVAGGVYPALVQRFRVTPNEQVQEKPYIERTILATNQAFGIDEVVADPFKAASTLSADVIKRNRDTIQNIRLWEPQVLRDAYLQLQRVKQYYEFLDVDVDRYEVGGERRMVMLSGREVVPTDLDPSARTWLNEHLVYTHGYGAVGSRVDRVTREGQPSFIIRNIPPSSSPGVPKVTQPRIYYGEDDSSQFAVVNTEQPELDYPIGDSDIEDTRYAGSGGVQLSGILRRAAFAWRFRDVNLLISGAIKPESRIMFRRDIVERVSTVAPFLKLDFDPYLTIIEGRIVWVLDAYTTTDMYPYAERVDVGAASEGYIRPAGQANYVRNAVKFFIDAENGTIDGYIWDQEDPIIRTWARAFPDIFRPRADMTQAQLAHVRYPEGLFRVQTDRYATYHIKDPVNFYLKEDAWTVAKDPSEKENKNFVNAPPVSGYYLLLKLPKERDLSFVLARPFTPNERQNLTAYMVAHGDCPTPDCPGYGQLVSYVFPKEESIFGPEQVFARINQDPAVSAQISLWNQQNSEVIFGNLQIIPVEESLLYVMPLYLKGAGSEFPELKRVVAVAGENVRMGDTLDEALASIFGEARPSQPGEEEPSVEQIDELLAQALEHFQLAEAALRRGDLAEYERQIARAEQLIRRAQSEVAPSPSPSPSPSP